MFLEPQAESQTHWKPAQVTLGMLQFFQLLLKVMLSDLSGPGSSQLIRHFKKVFFYQPRNILLKYISCRISKTVINRNLALYPVISDNAYG